MVFLSASPATRSRETYILKGGIKPKVDVVLARRSLFFKSSKGTEPALDLAASNGGVAFRYRLTDDSKKIRKIKKLKAQGAVGVKVDFWCSDRQETVTAILRLLRLAADHKMVVNLHGCTLPRGWHRTWPNLLTAEAVLGTESYMCEKRFPGKAAQLNTILPFTRNVCGPMDYTPLGLQKKRFERRTTAVHELATSLIFTSGIIHYADTPEVYNALPAEAQAILRDAPALWDETMCLVGEPGRAVVVARRSGKQWFVAGINGTDKPLVVRPDFNFMRGHKVVACIREGADPIMQMKAEQPTISDLAAMEMPARGGFVIRLAP